MLMDAVMGRLKLSTSTYANNLPYKGRKFKIKREKGYLNSVHCVYRSTDRTNTVIAKINMEWRSY